MYLVFMFNLISQGNGTSRKEVHVRLKVGQCITLTTLRVTSTQLPSHC